MAATRAAGDFGRRLREARERRGLSLRQIANATKISIITLEALEKNDIARLPGGIFSRAFVRAYALEVGLDPEETIREFMGQFPQDSVTAGHPASTEVEDREAVESDRRMASTFLRLLAISIPLAGVVIYFGSSAHRALRPSPPLERPSVAVETELPPPTVAPVADAVPTEPRSPTATSATVTPAASARRLTVRLVATKPCWVSATVDGRRAVERLFQPGDESTLDVHRELVLTAGDASAIALTLNGAAGRSLGGEGEMVTARLSLANFKDYLAVP